MFWFWLLRITLIIAVVAVFFHYVPPKQLWHLITALFAAVGHLVHGFSALISYSEQLSQAVVEYNPVQTVEKLVRKYTR